MLDRVYLVLLRIYRHVPTWARRLLIRTASPSFTVGAICVIERDDGAILVETRSPDAFYGRLARISLEDGTPIDQVYSDDDPNLDSDVQFAVTRPLVGRYVRHEAAAPAEGVEGPWYTLAHAFVLEPGVSTTPRAPIAGKADTRPALEVLRRRS